MASRAWPVAATVGAALLVGCAGAGARAAEDAGYPIWWSPKLALGSLHDIDADLASPFPSGVEITVSNISIEPEEYFDAKLGIYRLAGDEIARSCRSLIDLTAAGYDHGEYKIRAVLGARCYSLDALRTAKPARTSYLREFVFDDSAIRYLPAMLGPLGSCSYLKAMLEATRQGAAWAPFPNRDHAYGIGHVEAKDETTLIVVGKRGGGWKWVSTIQIYGRGDFNGDGLDDLLVRTDVEVNLWSARRAPRLFLLTRVGPDDALRVIWEYGVLPTIYNGCRNMGYDYALPNDTPFPAAE